jgi:hypothetical protein
MPARDILALDNNLAPRLIRCLYIVALILITVMVLLGVVRGVRLMSRPAMPPMTAADNVVTPDGPADGAAAPQPPPPGMMGGRFEGRRMVDRSFGRPRPFGPLGMGRLSRNPMLAGLVIIVSTLLRGAIMLMIVRILAELGLAVLAMPRRTEI